MKEQARAVKLEPSWKAALGDEFEKDYMLALREFLLAEKKAGQEIYPPSAEIFAAFNATPLDKTRIVIIGQDPYHGPGQAHGLCFSVRAGVPVPPSLRNIYKELVNDLEFTTPKHGNLMYWAEQGVLLLNSVLTVRAGQAASHQKKGWERFTDRVIDLLNTEQQHLVFMLWGSYAQNKGAMIDKERHLVLSSVHPSPLSASRGFFGNHHFSSANNYLEQNNLSPINWQLPLTV